MSYLTQMMGLTVQNFVSAATGIAILVAFVRGLARRGSQTIGNFWVDLVRSTLYILLPLAMIVALLLVGQGAVQTFDDYHTARVAQPVPYEKPVTDESGQPVVDELGRPKMEPRLRASRCWPSARPPRKSPLNISAPTGAASLAPTPRIPLRALRRSPTSC